MRLLVGLGNPGRKYRHTPHNLGFDVLDVLAQRAGLTFRASRKLGAVVADGSLLEYNVTLLKPATFMNLSGEAVSRFLRYQPIDVSDLLVITDDMNLPFGRLRFRKGGSHGGHKGLLSIISHLGSEEFPRLRIGVHPGCPVNDYVRFVLTSFPRDVRDKVDKMREIAADAVEFYLSQGIRQASNQYNGWRFFEAEQTHDENAD